MTHCKIEPIWTILRNYKFTSTNDIPSSVLCSICKEIMIDPYVTECGCQFCYECVYKNLQDGQRFCKGTKEECGQIEIEFGTNVVRDFKTRHQISHVAVKCPNNFCIEVFELRLMAEHIRLCEQKVMSCPYQVFGCSYSDNINVDLNNHMHSDVLAHSQLLTEIINHERNNYEKLNHLTKPLNEVDVRKLRDDVNEIKELILSIKEDHMAIRLEIETMKRSYERIVNATEFSAINVKDYIDQEIGKLETKSKRRSQQSEPPTPFLLQKISTDLDFQWKIENFSTKRGDYYQSSSFQKYNYTMCLRAWIDGNSLILYLWLLKGDRDEEAQWPMKHDVMLSIINQKSMDAHKCSTYNYSTHVGRSGAFNKPTNSRNDNIGGMKIYQSEIGRIDGILVNDAVLVGASLVD